MDKLSCPNCHGSEILAYVEGTLNVNENQFAQFEGDWTPNSPVTCPDCSWSGTYSELDTVNSQITQLCEKHHTSIERAFVSVIESEGFGFNAFVEHLSHDDLQDLWEAVEKRLASQQPAPGAE